MIVEKNKRGYWIISDIINGYWITRKYLYYTKKESINLYKQETR